MKHIVPFIIVLCICLCSCEKSKKQIAHIKSESEQKEIKKPLSYRDSIELVWLSSLVYGAQPQTQVDERQTIDHWYNFYFINGKFTTMPGIDFIHSKRTDSIMSSRFGKDWHDRFEKSVDSIYRIDSMTITIAKTDPFISLFCKNNDKHNDKYNYNPNFTFTAHTSPDSNIMVVAIDGYGVIHNKISSLNYLRATVDLRQKKVIHIDKTTFL